MVTEIPLEVPPLSLKEGWDPAPSLNQACEVNGKRKRKSKNRSFFLTSLSLRVIDKFYVNVHSTSTVSGVKHHDITWTTNSR